DLAREGSPPGHHVADVAPEEGVNAGEDEPVCHRARQAQPRGGGPPPQLVSAPLPPDDDGPVEQGALERAPGLAGRQDATIYLLVDAGDRWDEVWAGGDHVLEERVDAPGEGRGRAGRDADVFDQSREGVGERQEEEVDIPFSHDTERERRLDGREVIAVRLEHALRRPRRPRGVDDGRERIAAQRSDAPVDLPAEGREGSAPAGHEVREALVTLRVGCDLADPSFHLSPRDLLPPVGPPVPVTGTAGELTGALEEHVRETGERHARALLGRGGAPTLARPAATV